MRISDWSSDVCSSDLRVPGAFFVACVTSKRSDLVAERALDLALQILGLALALLRLAFGAKALVIGRLAGRLLRVAGGFVGEALRLFGEFTHGVSPLLFQRLRDTPFAKPTARAPNIGRAPGRARVVR